MIIQAINPFKYNNRQCLNNNTTFTSRQRVDKDLDRFYEVNKDRMPVNVYRYVDSLEDKSRLTPIEAQRRAFKKLEQAETVEDIKKLFPDEPLFTELKESSEVTAVKGLPAIDRKLGKDLEDLGIGVLKSKENLTVYLVKKTFLEAKSLEEINKDLEDDIEDIVKSEFKSKYPNTQYVSKSNLKLLGIKLPAPEYLNSLKFTREGYSDQFGETISLAQRIFWESLTPEQKTARAKKSVEKFERWWDSIEHDRKLEMIAEQVNTLEMLRNFKNSQLKNPERKDVIPTTTSPVHISDAVRSHTKIHSQKLSQDDLFRRWAANNFKIFEEQLSEEDKIKINEKRMLKAAKRWQEMSPVEKTEYLARLKSGSEPLRYVMINAWNNSFDLVISLSEFMREKQLERAEDEIYSKENFSEYMSKIMTEFWSEHHEDAIAFGREISKSWEVVNEAIRNGEFDKLKIKIDDNRAKRIDSLKLYRIQGSEFTEDEGEYIYKEEEIPAMFKEYYYGEEHNSRIFNRYFDDVAKITLSKMDENQKKNFHAYLNANLIFSDFDEDLKDIVRTTTKRTDKSFENAANLVLKDNIPDMPYKYLSELKYILAQMETGKRKVKDFSGAEYKTKGNINEYKLFSTYEYLKKDITEDEANKIMKRYFNGNNPKAHKAIKDRLLANGVNVRYIFSDQSPMPFKTRISLYEDFKKCIDTSNIRETMLSSAFIKRQDNMKNYANIATRTFGFLPYDFVKTFVDVSQRLDDEDFNMLYNRLTEKVSISEELESVLCLPTIPANRLKIDEKLKFIAVEKVLTELLAEYTPDVRIFSYQFDDVCNPLLTAYRDYSKGAELTMEGDNGLKIIFSNFPNFKKINPEYQSILAKCKEWYQDNKGNPNKDEALEDLVYILNPKAKNKIRDKFILEKLKNYNLQDDI